MTIQSGRTCTKCRQEKPVSAYAANRHRTSRLQAACRQCQYDLYNNPEKKAARRRRDGGVSRPYLTIEQIRFHAEEKRVARMNAAIERFGVLEAASAARARDRLVHVAGTPEWRAQIDKAAEKAFDMISALKALPRSGEYRLIRLKGIHAIGDYTHAIVDAEDYEYLSQWAWKAKPNGSGSGVYAVRTQKIDGKTSDVRMHREVMGIGQDEGMHSDHINHDTVDNRLSNLRLVTVSQNVLHRKPAKEPEVLRKCNSDDSYPQSVTYM